MRYSVICLGATMALYNSNNLAYADHMRMRWACKLQTCTVIVLDNDTGEVMSGL